MQIVVILDIKVYKKFLALNGFCDSIVLLNEVNMEEDFEIVVYDGMCGSGKSTKMMKLMQESCDKSKFLYITPLLSECHRVAGTETDALGNLIRSKDSKMTKLKFQHPNNKFGNSEDDFHQPYTKLNSLRELLRNKENIVSTHSLFLSMNLDTLSNTQEYTLIIDETLDVYEKNTMISTKEVAKLLKRKILKVREDGISLEFDREVFGSAEDDDEDGVKDTRYEQFAVLCDNKQLLLVNNRVVIWEFSADILKKFKKVIICSYLFEGREMSCYLKRHKIPYTIKKLKRSPSDIKHLINLVEDAKLNAVGDKYSALSISKTKVRDVEDFEYKGISRSEIAVVNDTLRKNLHNLFNARWKAKAGDRLYTCPKDNQHKIGNGQYDKSWLAFSTKATNDFEDVHNVAFLMNIFSSPDIKAVCKFGDVELDDDIVALSHLVQFVFRSAIRKEDAESINLYIPSSRMRELFQRWLEGEFDEI